MTSVVDYFDAYYPKGVMYRFFFGAGGARRLSLSRRAPGGTKSTYSHFGAMTLASAADVVRLFICVYMKNEDGETLKCITRNFISEPWTAMHIGWITAASIPLSHDGCITCDMIAYEIVFDFDLPAWDKKDVPLSPRKGFICSCALQSDGGAKAKAKTCRGCWALVRLARHVLEYYFQDSQWGQPLWVFSGGKGTHCYYGSPQARAVPVAQRDAIVKMLQNVMILPTTLRAAWEQIVVHDADVMASDAACRLLANAYLPAETATRFLGAMARCAPKSYVRWALFVQHAGETITRRVIRDMALPVVDPGPLTNNKSNVKAPFSIHQSTQRFALPLTDAEFAAFDPATSLSLPTLTPETAPRLAHAAQHLNQWLESNHYVY